MKFLLVLVCAMPLMAETELYFPWVPQNAVFQTTIVVNNHEAEMATVTLSATRSTSESETTTVEIKPFGSYQAFAQDLFPLLGSGSGSVVKITSASQNLTASCLVTATTTDSGFSPAQMNAIPLSSASTKLGYHHTPVQHGQSSALVAVNLGEQAAHVEFTLFANGKHRGNYLATLLPGEVFAKQTIEMFPDGTSFLYVTAQSDQPMIGASFVFNDQLEPALVSAQSLAEIPDPFNTVTHLTLRGPSSQFRVGETDKLEVEGLFIQDRIWGPANHLVVFENEAPTIVKLVTEGPDAGKITALKAGNARIHVTANGQTESEWVHVVSREIQFARGLRCRFSPGSCDDWEPISAPAFVSFFKTLDFIEVNPRAIDFFRIIGDESPLKVKRIDITSTNQGLPARVSGLRVGDIIQPGQTVFFTVDVTRLSGNHTTVELEIEMETQGLILRYRNGVRHQ